MRTRLTTKFWTQAYFRRLDARNIPFYLMKKGDPTAGSVIVKVNMLNGCAAMYQREYAPDGESKWVVTKEDAEGEIDKSISNQAGFDPDLWIIEVESADGISLLDEEGLTG